MNPVFGSSITVGTSADVESYFKTLIKGIQERKMYRADDFIEAHTEFLNSEFKLNAISSGDEMSSIKKRPRSSSLNERSIISPGKKQYI